MLPTNTFPWFGPSGTTSASLAFPWKLPLDSNSGLLWPSLFPPNTTIFDLKKEINDNSPLSATTSEVASDGTDCVVCGDKSSGKHYGQFSCEGCKSFFKRSIRRSLSYTCRAAKNCAIDVQHRNQCQYCRLKKCIRMGMRKEGEKNLTKAVQRGRIPVSLPNFFPSNPFMRPLPFLPSLPMFNQQMCQQKGLPVMNRESPESVFEFAAQTIFTTVNWARTSMSNLDKCDQAVLLRNSWSSIFLFALAHSTFSTSLSTYLKESTNIIHQSENVKLEENFEVVAELQSKVDTVKEYGLDIVEISSLRAILLFGSDEEEVKEKNKVVDITEKLTKALDEYCRNNKSYNRFSNLRECLKLLRTSKLLPISRLFFSKLVGSTSIESIISDLLNIPQSLPFPIPSQFQTRT